jgi:hypothetical protein
MRFENIKQKEYVMEKEYLYYKVTGGKIQEAYNKWLELYDKQQAARVSLCKEFGASLVFANSRGVEGLLFKDGQTPPTEWKRKDGHPKGVYSPFGSTKEMKAIRKRLKNNYQLADYWKFQEFIVNREDPFYFMDGMYMRCMGFELIGDQFILLVPKIEKTTWTPPDEFCTLLKNSEYWQLKENITETV